MREKLREEIIKDKDNKVAGQIMWWKTVDSKRRRLSF